MTQPALGDPLTERGKPGLTERIAIPVVAAKARGEEGLMPGKTEGCKEELRHPAISRRDGVIGRLQRRVEGYAHAGSAQAKSLADPRRMVLRQLAEPHPRLGDGWHMVAGSTA